MRGRKYCDPVSGCGKYYNQHANRCPHCGASEAFSEFKSYNPHDWVYDLETYPNIITADFKHAATGQRMLFEISEWRNDLIPLVEFLFALKQTGCRLVGFNNVGFDYPVIHFILQYYQSGITYTDIYNKAASIIATPWDNRFNNVIYETDVFIPQLDLYLIHHFDNKSRRTGLKMIEFNMRSESIEDLPFPPGTILTYNQGRVLISYNVSDVDRTEDFYIKTLDMIEFREKLTIKYGMNFLNHNDTKIGKDYFIMELEKNMPGCCYDYSSGRKVKRQTHRTSIDLNELIFPYINFKSPELIRIKEWLSSQVITETKGFFGNDKEEFDENGELIETDDAKIKVSVKGFEFVFGKGGIHGSIKNSKVYSDDDYIIYDWDVKSFYPRLGIVNRLYPHHLSEKFCDINEETYNLRALYEKFTPENAALKLALNGVYGDSNSPYSPLYDPQYTMSITINGQLLLCLLAENLLDIPDLLMIQANTDGLTVRCPRKYVDHMNKICEWWQKYTCLELEHVTYKRMFIRDVNSYIAEKENGKLKRKGAYRHDTVLQNPNTQELQWHQNHSCLVIPKAAEAALVRGEDIATFIKNHDDIYDFMLRTKVGRSDDLILLDSYGNKTQLQKITRYYISVDGGTLIKMSPPKAGCVPGQWKRKNGITDNFYNSVLTEINAEGRLPHEIDSTGKPWDDRINNKVRSQYDIRKTVYNVGWKVTPCNDISVADWGTIDYNYYIERAKKIVDKLS